jgi:hypothetical protein
MFTGQSAGGLGVFDNVNTIAPLIPSTVRFTAYSDAAFGKAVFAYWAARTKLRIRITSTKVLTTT